jgi:tRNA threonylcarbamoyladenosine biosynthesis protein TsaE
LWLVSRSPDETRASAGELALALGSGDLVIALRGPLGAGKTLFAKGLAEGLGIDPRRVASPTFAIASEYPMPGGRRLAHVDLYRVESEAELEAAGFLDLLAPGTLLVVEWADRFPAALPADRLEIAIERPPDAGGPERRVLHAVAGGERSRAVCARWRAARAQPGSSAQDGAAD